MDDTAYSAALKRLGCREYSSAEITAYLERKGFAPTEATAVSEELVKKGLVDDVRYARIVARHQTARGKGPAYIRAKLRAKGVNLTTAQAREVVAGVAEHTELERAREIVERRYPDCRESREAAAKAMQALVRRGFSFEVAREAVRTVSATPETP